MAWKPILRPNFAEIIYILYLSGESFIRSSNDVQCIISAHHYLALWIIITSCLRPDDPNCPSPMNIIKCEPRCTVILPLISSSSRDKDEKQTENRGKNLPPLKHWHGGFEAYRSGSESDWTCSVRPVLQEWVVQIAAHDPFVGVFNNPMNSTSTFGFVNEQRGHGHSITLAWWCGALFFSLSTWVLSTSSWFID